jgi:predicted RNase H-like HicB family nuclease
MTTYTIVFEKTDTGFSAYSPELPGMGVAGETLAETRQLAIEAIDFHLDGYAQRPKTIAMVSSPNLIVNCATFGPPRA